ncbi:uncharacterized protein LOC129772525 [Toxorhynchites rutilus septentrionalis]|uniref:uncharacterized protein LOC129772525 n=1 Tax=Toxorhynchites rutilus septentrionalis TaxID=329112 RepID=UPI002478B3EE|nr:uncharacterized protein LOC129772525 [Toxorhynchites rutilus septentrionalis]
MYEVISCAKDTQLHTFPSFNLLSTSAHVNGNGSDCQFFPASKLFLRANKNWGVEMMRIKTVDGKPTLGNVKKITMDNLYCVACPKTDREDIAIGLTSGVIRLMNYKKSSATKRFEADRIANGVTCLDFNATDDCLAAVYESGTVNLFGIKTNARVATMTFDKHTTKVRFHPTRRFLMAVASYNGSVVLYDTQSKKVAFSQSEAHSAPCRDIGMTSNCPDALFTVGYDNVINIFDTRKKLTASQIRSNYPFESIAVSECGGFFCVGNLKGFVSGYDMRNLAEPLKTSKIHDNIVNSIAFVPKPSEKGGHRVSFDPAQVSKIDEVSLTSNSGGSRPGSANNSQNSQNANKSDQDSFMGEIDLFLQRRDSMDYMSRLSSSSRLSTESRSSINMGGGNNLMGYLDDISDSNLDVDQGGNVQSNLDDSFVNVNRLLKRTTTTTTTKKQSFVDRTQKSTINLENIREESHDNDSSRTLAEIPADTNVEPQKPMVGVKKSASFRRSVATENKENHFDGTEKNSTPQSEVIITSTPDWDTPKTALPTTTSTEPIPASVQLALQELKLEIANFRTEIREEMKEHFFQNKVDRKYTAQATRSHAWMGAFNLWRETQKKLDRVDEVTQTGFGLLLSNDEFTQQFLRLQRENEALKQRIAELEQTSVRK